MRKYLFFNIAFVIITFFAAHNQANANTFIQTEKLVWDEQPKKVFINDNTNYSLYGFKGVNYTGATAELPYFNKSYPINVKGAVSISLQNEIYETVAADFIPAEAIQHIAETVHVTAHFEQAGDNFFAEVEMMPIRKGKNGQFEKLVSFSLKIDVQPQQKKTFKNTYAENSKLATGTWFKLEVGNEGIYKLDANTLNQLNINASAIAADEFKVYTYNGGMLPESNAEYNSDDLIETPVEIIDADGNNRLELSDGILFYVPGLHKWKFNSDDNLYEHQQHHYSNKNYVFINIDGAKSKQIQTVASASSANYNSNTFDLLRVHESESNNLTKSGREWFGELFEFENEFSFNFDLPNVVETEPVLITTKVGAKTIGISSSFDVMANNKNFDKHTLGPSITVNYSPEAKVKKNTKAFTINEDKLKIDLIYNQTTTGAKGWLDYIEINARAKLELSNNIDQLVFSDKNSVGANKITQFTINGNEDIKVWEISNLKSIKAFKLNDRKFSVETNSLKKFIAFNNNNLLAPVSAEKIENQNIHGEPATDYLIISHPEFVVEAERLADYHRENSGLSVLVTTPQKIYNEFSNGITDVTALRNFVRMFYNRAGNNKTERPQFLLLFGDATYDYLNLKIDAENNTNFVPTFESYESVAPIYSFCTDDYFVLMDANEGTNLDDIGKPDVAVGRIPCTTLTHAKDAVDKVMHYKSIASRGSWQNIFTMLADDQDGNLHFDDAEYHCRNLKELEPCVNIEKIYLDAYEQESTTGGGRYPEVNEAINRKIETGTLVFNYAGHGGENGFAHERVVQFNDIDSWDNKDNMPLLVTATCSFSRYDNPEKFSAGERVILRANGGAIGNVTTLRVVYASQNRVLNAAFIDHLYEKENGKHLAVGTILQYAKEGTSVTTNVRKFALLGDPALVLNYPEYNVSTTAINNIPLSEFTDTLRALDKVKIAGEVRGLDNAKMENFNGTVYPSIYDKTITLTTLANDEDSYPASFDLQNKIIFKGQSTIKNGNFEFEFIIPKDIKLFYGYGKISYYALSDNGIDAKGCDENIVVGGISETVVNDTQKPTIELYMNNRDFIFGGTTSESPDLLVDLFDESGINTVGNGIGHNITGILDGNEREVLILNDYYRAEESFAKGVVRYPLKNLEEGKHTLKVRAFDVHNNWSEAYLEFYVFNSEEATINNVLNYPNPFTTHTEFHFEHNQPADNLEAQIKIYTLQGKLVKTIQQVLPANTFRVNNITWNGLDSYDNKLGKGTYIYKVSINNGEEIFSSNFQKLMLLR